MDINEFKSILNTKTVKENKFMTQVKALTQNIPTVITPIEGSSIKAMRMNIGKCAKKLNRKVATIVHENQLYACWMVE